MAFYAIAPMKNADFNNQTYDNIVNSFMRPLWALGIGWLILACAEGYGGEKTLFKILLQFESNIMNLSCYILQRMKNFVHILI